ncbi:hypothetical protein V9K67_18765 [Paraflavisolibacter sp. H34]|uniref:hypothetical protein n=1 Tax=Huijunlia imazamoxiresistens TaxID=3127457 RepID=UPI003017B9A9
MKNLLLPCFLCLVFAFCSQPPNITTQSDEQATTSGTVGSSRATNELPRNPADTTLKPDTAALNRDSTLPRR